MSEPVMQRLKISREGIILIKSFEGFRPHAVRRDDGHWVIGYGHTLSAREGGVVSEPDAELLLQFDLIPVVKALNDTAGPLNQHQFDALASFAFSVGVDRFKSSDVLFRLACGSTGEAADAIVGWTEPTSSDTPLRRRAAERALFVADPGRPVALAELLSAPLPPRPVAPPVLESPTATDAEPALNPAPEPDMTPVFADGETPQTFAIAISEAVSTEVAPEIVAPEIVAPEAVASEVVAPEAVLHELSGSPVASAPAETIFAGPATTAGSEAGAEPDAEAEPQVEPETAVKSSSPMADDASELADRAEREAAALSPGAAPSGDPSIEQVVEPEPARPSQPFRAPPSIQRYAPYAASIVGPLPGAPASFTPVGVTPIETTGVEAFRPIFEEAPVQPFPTATADFAEPVPGFDAGSDAAIGQTGDHAVEIAAFAEEPPFQLAVSAEGPADTDGELQVLSPLDEASVFPTQRLVWPHAEPVADQAPLFEDDGALRLGAHQMIRHEVVSEEPRRIDWRETGLYVLMGAFGLLTFGMSMAAFRRASLPSGGSEFTTIAWVLAVFGFACIAVSAWNLYRKLGRPED